jgi:hypothetical protein
MAFTSWNNGPDYLYRLANLPRASMGPVTMACFLRNPGFAGSNVPMSLVSLTHPDPFIGLYVVGSGTLAAVERDNSNTQDLGGQTGAAFSSAWQHAAVVFNDTATTINAQVYQNGTKRGTLTASGRNNAGSLFTGLSIGSESNSFPSPADIAEAAVWIGQAVSPQQIAAMAAGRSPLAVAPDGLWGYWRLQNDLRDYSPNGVGLLNSTNFPINWTDHPLVDPPPRFQAYRFKAASTGITVTLDMPNPMAFLSGLRADMPGNVDWLASRVATMPMPAEFRSTLRLDTPSPAEFLSTLRLDATSPAEWRRNLALDARSPLEWKSTLRLDATSPMDWLRAVIADAPMPSDQVRVVHLDAQGQIAFSTTVSVDELMQMEWQGGVSVALDAAMPLEWASSLGFDQPMPIEWLGSVIIMRPGRVTKLRPEIRTVIVSPERRFAIPQSTSNKPRNS